MTDDARFYAAFRNAAGALSDAAVAGVLEVTRLAVSRWRSGRNAPAPAVRARVLEWCRAMEVGRG